MARRSKRTARKAAAPRKRTARKTAAARRVSMQEVRQNHEDNLKALRRQEADLYMDAMDRANRVMNDSSQPPEDIAAAQTLYNEMQQSLARLKTEHGVG